jgi:thioredoxin-like negative regulator of GroEL
MNAPSITDQTVQSALIRAGWGPIKPEAIFRTVRAQDERIKAQNARIASLEAQATAAPEAAKHELDDVKDSVVASVRLAMFEIDQGQQTDALERLRSLCLALA